MLDLVIILIQNFYFSVQDTKEPSGFFQYFSSSFFIFTTYSDIAFGILLISNQIFERCSSILAVTIILFKSSPLLV